MSLGSYELFIRYFKELKGLDLNSYKETQMKRRIEQFITARGFTSYAKFKDSLQTDSELMAAFTRHLTINVSQFFRDSSQWKILIELAIPSIVKGKNHLKIWSAGCSAGQEPYTLAIILQEYFPQLRYSILATDIDETILEQAKSGIYKSNDLQGVSPLILHKYFDPVQNGYRITENLKHKINFQKRDLLSGIFDTGYDLISCRNVVIYFTEESKNNLYKRFSNSLNPGGILFMGSTEQIFNLSELGLKSVAPFFYQKM